jgi:hypothetical protein
LTRTVQTLMDNDVAERLRAALPRAATGGRPIAEMIAGAGRSAEIKDRLVGLIADVAGSRELECSLLVDALQDGVPEALLGGNSGEPLAARVNKQAQRVARTRGTAVDNATWAARGWAVALGLADWAAFPSQREPQPGETVLGVTVPPQATVGPDGPPQATVGPDGPPQASVGAGNGAVNGTPYTPAPGATAPGRSGMRFAVVGGIVVVLGGAIGGGAMLFGGQHSPGSHHPGYNSAAAVSALERKLPSGVTAGACQPFRQGAFGPDQPVAAIMCPQGGGPVGDFYAYQFANTATTDAAFLRLTAQNPAHPGKADCTSQLGSTAYHAAANAPTLGVLACYRNAQTPPSAVYTWSFTQNSVILSAQGTISSVTSSELGTWWSVNANSLLR